MKNWISRILSGTDDNQRTPAAGALDDAPAPGEQNLDLTGAIDAAYYRWLTASASYDAPADAEKRILDTILDLARAPGDAAGLVPRVPEVIPRLLQTLGDEGASAAELSRQVAQDVVLAAEVIREANSAYYRPISPVKAIEAAIMMLGQNGLRMLLARIAFRPIINMQGDGFARRAAPTVWRQSERCALAASLLAPGLTASIFEAYLAGLMQNVGLIVAFRLADRLGQPGKVPGSSAFGARLLACSRQLSAGIARHWGFPPAVADAIVRANDPDGSPLAQALALGDHIAKLRLLIDGGVLAADDALVTDGLDAFQRRCLGKLGNLDD